MKNYLLMPLVVLILCSCASYNTANLSALQSVPFQTENGEDFSVACKAYDRIDCKRFLDRNVLEKGYQPIQITIQNNGSSTYAFSPNDLSLPVTAVDYIAQQVHTNTFGRVAGYTAGSLLLGPLLWIPAVVDGLKSKEANKMLDIDYQAKTARSVDIAPGDTYNAIVFVPRQDYKTQFTATLHEVDGDKSIQLPLTVR